jgi:predicted RNA binding protein YcfA (HicA-like mRNA interferase family)
MPKIPRDLSGRELCRLLKRIGYDITRQSGSHIRLTRTTASGSHNITIPDHTPVKIGTLNKILSDVALHLNISKDELVRNIL